MKLLEIHNQRKEMVKVYFYWMLGGFESGLDVRTRGFFLLGQDLIQYGVIMKRINLPSIPNGSSLRIFQPLSYC